MSLTFINDGEIDIYSVTSFGVSVKENDSAIGYFGTGLKYAIAIILRNGCSFKILSGENTYEFYLKDRVIRGVDFKIISIRGSIEMDTGFTTELGKNWENWQAFREVYSNMLDEGGFCLPITDDLCEINKTKIIIDGSIFDKYFNNVDRYFLKKLGDNISNMNGVEIYNAPSETLFYKGVAVANCKRSTLTFNVTRNITLTEDRTIKNQYDYESLIPKAISSISDREIIKKILLSKNDFEKDLSFDSLDFWPEYRSSEFDEIIEHFYKENSDKVNKTAIALYGKIKKTKPKNIVPCNPNEYESKCIDMAMTLVSELVNIDQREIVLVASLGENTYGLAQDGKIIISKSCIDMGLKFLASTIYEEIVHLDTGYNDNSRELQTYLFDKIISVTAKNLDLII